MKTLLTILLLTVAVNMAAQYDTTSYMVSQYDFQKLSQKVDGIETNMELYGAQRREAFLWMGGAVFASIGVTAYNLNTDSPQPFLSIIPAAISVVGIVRLLGAEKYLRRVEVTGSGVRVKF